MSNQRHFFQRLRLFAAGLPFLLLSLSASFALAEYDELIGVASVIDGDTIEIHGTRIRLYGIDAPESRQNCMCNGEAWRCGRDAAFALSDEIGHQTVRCEKKGTDRYRRFLGLCYLGTTDLNGWLVEEGWAVAYRQYSSKYVKAEDAARQASRRIWASEFDMPWDWRKGRRNH